MPPRSASVSVTPKYIVREVNLEHSGDLTSDELDNIEPKLLGYCFNAPGRPSEIVRDELQQRGYFRAFVHEAHVFSLGDGTLPQPVRVTIALEAGRVYHLDEIFFRDATAFTPEQLRPLFLLQPGDVFNVAKVREGMNAMHGLYAKRGYTNMTPVPETELNEQRGTVRLVIDIAEGEQKLHSPN